jgi:SAM-dependent methyltransferase
MEGEALQKAALRGEPSHVWRAGQVRRLAMIQQAAAERSRGRILVDGCGLGAYLVRLAQSAELAVGLDIEFERTVEARQNLNGVEPPATPLVVCGAGEFLPFPPGTFDLILSHEVLEHVQDDAQAVAEIVRTLKPGGRLVLFCPNRGYPYETHGIYWRGKYKFGNIPLVNWLPNRWRNKLAPHVRAYTYHDLQKLFASQPVKLVEHTIVFGAYDNIIARFPRLGRLLRGFLQFLERTPLRIIGLSHFWVVEKTAS